MREILGIRTLTPDQEKLVGIFERSRRVLVKSGNAVGKCRDADSLLTLADGRRVRVGDLIDSDFDVLTLDEAGTVVTARARAEYNAFEEVYEVATDGGRTLRVNAQHPLWAACYLGRHGDRHRAPVSPAEWTSVGKLRPGMVVAVADGLPVAGRREMDARLVRLVGYLIGDGGLTNGNLIFTQAPGEVRDDFLRCCEELGIAVTPLKHDSNGFYVSKVNALGELMAPLRGCHSRDKHIPDFVWTLRRELQVEFVKALWATDGSFPPRPPSQKARYGGATAEFTTISERLAQDVQHLLLRLGVSARLRRRTSTMRRADGSVYRVASFCVHTIAAADTEALCLLLQGLPGKSAACQHALERAKGVMDRRRAEAGRRPNSAYVHWRRYGLPASLRWERVQSVKSIGYRDTVAISVPGYETYLDDFYEHNTHLLSAYGVYYLDVYGAQLDNDGEPEGALWIMSHPTADGIFKLLWSAALGHIRKAQRLGYTMPGFHSERSVTWHIRDDWRAEGISPPKRAGELQQHGGAGRHHKNLLITFDEAPGIEAERYRAAEGMASGEKNKFIKVGNPTENVGTFYEYATSKSGERIFTLSALNHPNVVERKEVVPGAKSHVDIDSKVRDWCENRGDWPEVQPNPEFHDIVYALHPDVGTPAQESIPDPMPYDGEYDDGTGSKKRILGHAMGRVCVFRPDHRFLSSEMGEFPLESVHGLFSRAALERAVAMWEETSQSGQVANLQPHRVAIDPAESEGGDLPMSAPLYRVIAPNGKERERVGRMLELARGTGEVLAASAYRHYGHRAEYVVDVNGIGTGAESHLRSNQGVTTFPFRVSAVVGSYRRQEGDPPYLLDEPLFGNARAAAYWRAAQKVNRGEVEIPPDEQLIQELINTVYVIRRGKMYILEKKELRKVLGRSPDRADTLVMLLYEERESADAGGVYMQRYQPAPTQAPTDFSFYEERTRASG